MRCAWVSRPMEGWREVMGVCGKKEKRVWVWLNGWDGKMEGWIVEQEVRGACGASVGGRAGFQVQRVWQQSRGRGRSRRQEHEHGRYVA